MKLNMLSIILASAILLGTACSMKIDKTINPNTKRVDNYLKNMVKEREIPGVQYAIMDSNEIIHEHIGGFKDLKNMAKLDAKTTMFNYSIAKILTAAAVVQLYDKDLISLDDTISKYVKNHPYGNKITIRQLLNYTSGIPNPMPINWPHTIEEHPSHDEYVYMDKIMNDNNELDFEPGSKYSYSNIPFYLLGLLIEEISNQKYEEYVANEIFKPLGITEEEMTYTINPKTISKGYIEKYSGLNMALYFLAESKYYSEPEESFSTFKYLYNSSNSFGGGYSTASGWVKFLQDMLKDESVLFSKSAKNEFFKQQFTNTGDPITSCLGWQIGYNNGHMYIGKPGGGAGFFTNIRIYPELKIASVVLVNITRVSEDPIYEFVDKLDSEFIE